MVAYRRIAFPQVWKNSESKTVAIVYWNRAEYYGGYRGGFRSYPFKNRGRGNEGPFNEVDMLKHNGYKRVHIDEVE